MKHHAFTSRVRPSTPAFLGVSAAGQARSLRRKLSFHELEDRTLLSTIMWDATDHPTGGSWDDATNWVGGVLPGPTNQVVIDLSGTGTVTLGNGVTDTVNSLTTNSHTSISISGDTLSLATSSTIGGGLGVTSGSVAINSGTLTLDGGGSDSGTISVLGSSTLDLASSYEVAATGKVTGTGSVTLASGTLTLDPGHTYDVTGGLTAAGGSATFGTGDTLGPVISASGGSVTFGAGTNLPALTSVTESGGTLNFSTGSDISIGTIEPHGRDAGRVRHDHRQRHGHLDERELGLGLDQRHGHLHRQQHEHTEHHGICQRWFGHSQRRDARELRHGHAPGDNRRQ